VEVESIMETQSYLIAPLTDRRRELVSLTAEWLR
jgi:hypothetical protein